MPIPFIGLASKNEKKTRHGSDWWELLALLFIKTTPNKVDP
jgi:hypothetical protein